VASTSLEFVAAEGGVKLDADQRNALEIARAGLRKVLKLITNILDLRWLEGGRVPLERTAVRVNVLVDETLRAQSSLAAAKRIRLESQVPTDLPTAWADADLIGRVLQNLVDNACKFTPAGGSVQVTARLALADKRPVIQVSVGDTGPGIPPPIRPRLFQKFVTGQQKGHGSGLGLAFCKLALEAHGERIWLESDSERGTTFTFSLPVFEGAGSS
jgi:signal transduction histidine kinase